MIYKEFILALQEAAGSFRWRLGYFHEIRATRGHRVDFSPLSAVAWHQTRLPLGSLTHPEVVRLLDLHPEMALRIYQASERLNPYHPEIASDLLDCVLLKDNVGWGPPFDNGRITRPESTCIL